MQTISTSRSDLPGGGYVETTTLTRVVMPVETAGEGVLDDPPPSARGAKILRPKFARRLATVSGDYAARPRLRSVG